MFPAPGCQNAGGDIIPDADGQNLFPLARQNKMGLPFISILTNPTTAGVMASYASLGDIIIAEPKALLGFAGPRVIQQTIGQELPKDFQSSEFFLEHGFVDLIVERGQLKQTVSLLLEYLSCCPQ